MPFTLQCLSFPVFVSIFGFGGRTYLLLQLVRLFQQYILFDAYVSYIFKYILGACGSLPRQAAYVIPLTRWKYHKLRDLTRSADTLRH